MKIKIARMSDGETHWQETISPESIELDASVFQTPLCIDLIVIKRPGKIQIEVKVEANQSIICDRCCEDIVLTTSGECSVYFSERESINLDEEEGDDFRCFILGQEDLDVTREIRDALLLSLPFQNYCSEDCKGLCAKCGANLNLKDCQCDQEVIESSVELNNSHIK